MMNTIILNGEDYPMSDIKSMSLVWDDTVTPPRFMLQVTTFSKGALPDMEANAENMISYGLWLQIKNATLLSSIQQLQTRLLLAQVTKKPKIGKT
jgi:hypothetical protein